MKLEHSLTSYTKINSKCIEDLNVRPDTTKLYEGNISRTLFVISCSKIFFDPPPRIMKIKTNKQDLIKCKRFYKENHKQDEKTIIRMGENICT